MDLRDAVERAGVREGGLEQPPPEAPAARLRIDVHAPHVELVRRLRVALPQESDRADQVRIEHAERRLVRPAPQSFADDLRVDAHVFFGRSEKGERRADQHRAAECHARVGVVRRQRTNDRARSPGHGSLVNGGVRLPR